VDDRFFILALGISAAFFLVRQQLAGNFESVAALVALNKRQPPSHPQPLAFKKRDVSKELGAASEVYATGAFLIDLVLVFFLKRAEHFWAVDASEDHGS
jgi:hypothetical protein